MIILLCNVLFFDDLMHSELSATVPADEPWHESLWVGGVLWSTVQRSEDGFPAHTDEAFGSLRKVVTRVTTSIHLAWYPRFITPAQGRGTQSPTAF